MPQNIDSLLRAYYTNLSEKYKQIADYILKTDHFDQSLTIQELALDCAVSTATISRFAKALTFANFQALKMALLAKQRPTDNPLFHEISSTDNYLTMADKIFTSNTNALKATRSLLTDAQLQQAVNYINHAKRLNFFGLGASGIVAQDGYHKFLRTTIPTVYNQDYHLQLMQATQLTVQDCALIISHSGQNKDALEIARILKERRVPLIVITSFGNSTLANLGDVTLLSISEETNYRAEALHALIAQISIVDSLFMMVAVTNGAQTEQSFQAIRTEIDRTRQKGHQQ
ncbi:MurR/RpiR family transcriptional regulator [Latilactobacillus graminis]|uniref:Helix-turn-helix domain, rpiR family protein n=2 Tax=Latilactobacillus graminis TaxID=60519 RepID=A0AA89I2J2_9LACO|nr:MurR/RpiR family transcriptional regulator [Latilactobacillus graminis]KRM24345.1 helix-turn-helix domain, rpiR family protein [Latilactobacillus graminis DSM 20719]QFP80101.1 MurR/RpiR family transcriptional regulator [Latilactobacillus graminis]